MISIDKKEALESKTFCILPFNHLFVQPNGEVQACCVSDEWNSAANVKTESIDSAFNSNNHTKLRKDMITGVENHTCANCYKSERVTGHSSRLMYNELLKGGIYTIPDIKDDYTVPPTFQHIDIRFSNLCNLKCRMCNHIYSSEWFEDSIALNKLPPNQTKVVKIGNNITQRLENHIKEVKTVYFAGGEPLVMPEHLETLKALTDLHQNNRTTDSNKIDIHIHYNTNLKVLRYEGTQFIEYWKQYKLVNLSISCDGVGKVGEYQRVGFKTKNLLDNLDTLTKAGFKPVTPGEEFSNLMYNFQYTVTPLNIMHLPEFIKFMLDHNFIKSSSTIDFRYAVEPEEFNIRNITNVDYVSNFLSKETKFFDTTSLQALDRLITHMKEPPVMEQDEIFKFYSTLDKLNIKTSKITHNEFTDNLFTITNI